ncbi:hypothetical protein LTR36_009647 [Oleoguttula mirabilis]|uniref:Uncharacterized protein n=1 Tax=Oleoguttula mirabilis TaxID=1507867 RepID=A0AAV9J5I7_9PEZI|nr:hypothetical protein LTR36_009647 [Oleoguttula mirabilis]
MNHTQHDELAQLFAQNMHLAQAAPQQQQLQPQLVEQVPQQLEKTEQPIHFISSHYTQTAHIRPDTTSEPSRSPPPPYNDALMPEAMAETLRQHAIDPSALLPNQVQLFANADYEQRLRLLELWRIAPPSYPLEAHLSNKWQPTSVQREEEEARVRYEQKTQVYLAPPEEHMLDTHIAEPMSAIRDADEAAWPPAARMRAASIAANLAQSRARQAEAEPYMVNGYQADQHSQSTDPVYAASAGLWQAPSYAQAVQQHSDAMENQYGMYEQIRNHADWEAMNERMARENFVGFHGPVEAAGGDHDMVM